MTTKLVPTTVVVMMALVVAATAVFDVAWFCGLGGWTGSSMCLVQTECNITMTPDSTHLYISKCGDMTGTFSTDFFSVVSLTMSGTYFTDPRVLAHMTALRSISLHGYNYDINLTYTSITSAVFQTDRVDFQSLTLNNMFPTTLVELDLPDNHMLKRVTTTKVYPNLRKLTFRNSDFYDGWPAAINSTWMPHLQSLVFKANSNLEKVARKRSVPGWTIPDLSGFTQLTHLFIEDSLIAGWTLFPASLPSSLTHLSLKGDNITWITAGDPAACSQLIITRQMVEIDLSGNEGVVCPSSFTAPKRDLVVKTNTATYSFPPPWFCSTGTNAALFSNSCLCKPNATGCSQCSYTAHLGFTVSQYNPITAMDVANCHLPLLPDDWFGAHISDFQPQYMKVVSEPLWTSLPNTLSVVTSLTSLSLIRLPLLSLPDDLPYALQQIHISGTDTSAGAFTIPTTAFSNQLSLTSLDFSDNGLTRIPGRSIGTICSLKSLDLRGNNLESLPFDIYDLPSLQTLDLSGNPNMNCTAVLHSCASWDGVLAVSCSSTTTDCAAPTKPSNLTWCSGYRANATGYLLLSFSGISLSLLEANRWILEQELAALLPAGSGWKVTVGSFIKAEAHVMVVITVSDVEVTLLDNALNVVIVALTPAPTSTTILKFVTSVSSIISSRVVQSELDESEDSDDSFPVYGIILIVFAAIALVIIILSMGFVAKKVYKQQIKRKQHMMSHIQTSPSSSGSPSGFVANDSLSMPSLYPSTMSAVTTSSVVNTATTTTGMGFTVPPSELQTVFVSGAEFHEEETMTTLPSAIVSSDTVASTTPSSIPMPLPHQQQQQSIELASLAKTVFTPVTPDNAASPKTHPIIQQSSATSSPHSPFIIKDQALPPTVKMDDIKLDFASGSARSSLTVTPRDKQQAAAAPVVDLASLATTVFTPVTLNQTSAAQQPTAAIAIEQPPLPPPQQQAADDYSTDDDESQSSARNNSNSSSTSSSSDDSDSDDNSS